MADFNDNRFASKNNTWETPDDLFTKINSEFNFTLDVAASAENTKCAKFFTQEDNGLVQDWGKEICWLNPPYGDGISKLSNWVKKGREASLLGATVVILIPARTNTEWFHNYCLKGEVRFVRGRPKFKGAKHGLPQPLLFVIFKPPEEADNNDDTPES